MPKTSAELVSSHTPAQVLAVAREKIYISSVVTQTLPQRSLFFKVDSLQLSGRLKKQTTDRLPTTMPILLLALTKLIVLMDTLLPRCGKM